MLNAQMNDRVRIAPKVRRVDGHYSMCSSYDDDCGLQADVGVVCGVYKQPDDATCCHGLEYYDVRWAWGVEQFPGYMLVRDAFRV